MKIWQCKLSCYSSSSSSSSSFFIISLPSSSYLSAKETCREELSKRHFHAASVNRMLLPSVLISVAHAKRKISAINTVPANRRNFVIYCSLNFRSFRVDSRCTIRDFEDESWIQFNWDFIYLVRCVYLNI